MVNTSADASSASGASGTGWARSVQTVATRQAIETAGRARQPSTTTAANVTAAGGNHRLACGAYSIARAASKASWAVLAS